MIQNDSNKLRHEAIKYTSQILLTAAAALIAAAALGWWFYIEPKIAGYIAENASSVPEDVILLSPSDCVDIGDEWVAFTKATGRFVVAAGNQRDTAYATWTLERGDGSGQAMALREYTLLEHGGEEKHMLTVPELAEHNHGGNTTPGNVRYMEDFGSGNRKYGGGPYSVNAVNQAHGIPSDGNNEPHNNLPPYVALNFCIRNP